MMVMLAGEAVIVGIVMLYIVMVVVVTKTTFHKSIRLIFLSISYT